MYYVLPHERWDVYQRALELAALVRAIAARLPANEADLGDQAVRAGTSVPLNIAEGAGEHSRKDKARYYRIAKRSAFECKAALSVIEHSYPNMPQPELRRAIVLSHHIARSLAALIRSIAR